MREAIYKRRTRIDEVPVRGPSRELARLQMDAKERAEREPRVWPDNYSGNGDLLLDTLASSSSLIASSASSSTVGKTIASVCQYCKKTFERRAALITHIKSCPQKANNPAARHTATSTGSGGSRRTDTDAIDKDDDSSGSAESFLAMLQREKSIQSLVQQQTDDNDDNKQAAPPHKAVTVVGNVNIKQESNGDPPITDDVDEIKNKRKRNRARKTMPLPLDDYELDDDILWSSSTIADDATTVDTSRPSSSTAVIESSAVLNFDDDSSSTKLKKSRPSSGNGTDLERTTDCTICDKKFANISNLRRHVSMFHYREKKFGCKLCSFKAHRRIDVVNHLIQHDIHCDKDAGLRYVKLIDIDKNKFNDEKLQAISKALDKLHDHEEDDACSAIVKLEPNTASADDDIIIPLLSKEELMRDEPTLVLDDDMMMMSIDEEELPTNRMEDGEEQNQSPPSSTPNVVVVKRRGRPKGTGKIIIAKFGLSKTPNPRESTNCSQVPATPNKSTKLTRHSSSNSSSSEETSRRPVRNRIPSAKKDFVYDLSNLLKTEAHKEYMPITTIRAQKRKIAQVLAASLIETHGGAVGGDDDSVDGHHNHEGEASADLMDKKRGLGGIEGAALIMANIAVHASRACFYKQPEMPSERPIVPAKIIALRRSENSPLEWTPSTAIAEPPSVVDENVVAKKMSLRRGSNEKLYDALTKKKLLLLKRSKSLSSSKLFSSMQNECGGDDDDDNDADLSPSTTSEMDKILVKLPNAEEFKNCLIANGVSSLDIPVNNHLSSQPSATTTSSCTTTSITNHMNSLADSSLVSPTKSSAADSVSAKRISVLQRLAENKTKKIQESLLKLSISGGGGGSCNEDDVDEDVTADDGSNIEENITAASSGINANETTKSPTNRY